MNTEYLYDKLVHGDEEAWFDLWDMIYKFYWKYPDLSPQEKKDLSSDVWESIYQKKAQNIVSCGVRRSCYFDLMKYLDFSKLYNTVFDLRGQFA